MPSKADELFETFGASQLDDQFGVLVVYSQGGISSASITATYQDQEYEVVDAADALPQSVKIRDWIVKAADLVIGSLITPRRGDLITDSDTGDVYEVLPVGKRRPCELLPGEYRYLIHTKRIAK